MGLFYYAKERAPEAFDSTVYDLESLAESNDIIVAQSVDGKSGQTYYNADLLNDVNAAIENLQYDIDYIYDHFGTVYDFNNIQAAIDDEFDDPIKFARFGLSNVNKNYLISLARNTGYVKDWDTFCEVLSILKGTRFYHKQLTGSVQGEYTEYIYPKKVRPEYADHFEAVIFGTGREFDVTVDKYDENPFETDDYVDSYSVYYPYGNDTDMQKKIADDIGCTPNTVKIIPYN